MKKAGDLLSVFFDEKTIAMARTYSRLISTWEDIVAVYKIDAAADHSRIVKCDQRVVLVEADHPGWIQILQTKQQQLLHELQRRFPDFNIAAVSFRLSRKPFVSSSEPEIEESAKPEPAEEPLTETTRRLYEKIDNPELVAVFKRLERNLAMKGRKT
jgi:hypothetical protein